VAPGIMIQKICIGPKASTQPYWLMCSARERVSILSSYLRKPSASKAGEFIEKEK
jgi:hypothetical protein